MAIGAFPPSLPPEGWLPPVGSVVLAPDPLEERVGVVLHVSAGGASGVLVPASESGAALLVEDAPVECPRERAAERFTARGCAHL